MFGQLWRAAPLSRSIASAGDLAPLAVYHRIAVIGRHSPLRQPAAIYRQFLDSDGQNLAAATLDRRDRRGGDFA